MLLRLLLVAVLLFGASCGSVTGHRPASLDSAAAAEVGATVDALYAVISGPAGQKRDWNRLRELFHKDARMVPLVPRRGSDGVAAMLITPEDYIQRSGPSLEKEGFYEQEIHRELQLFGDFAHVWSTYEGRRALDDEQPFLEGINSIQLVRVDGRWQVLSLLWEQAAQAGPIPSRYLPR